MTAGARALATMSAPAVPSTPRWAPARAHLLPRLMSIMADEGLRAERRREQPVARGNSLHAAKPPRRAAAAAAAANLVYTIGSDEVSPREK